MGFRLFETVPDLFDSMKGSFLDQDADIKIVGEERLRDKDIDWLIYNAIFNPDAYISSEARSTIRTIAMNLGIYLSSIQKLYEAMGRGECAGLSVPAINIRGLTFDAARAVFRAAIKHNAGAFTFEIAKSEIGYTDQRPSEYTAAILAAAIKENFRGPVFIQGDHFQVNAKKYAEDPSTEIASLKSLITEAIENGFYNIDIDASTLVELNQPTVAEQQRPNFEVTADLTSHIRSLPCGDIVVSVGGEIGEVGSKNSTEEELRAFMDGLNETLGQGVTGISKVSVQTGTSHGGVVKPDGTIAEVNVDFDTIERLSVVSRKVYGLSGVVQHGASTLPNDCFHLFVERGASEVHLATGFQNIIYDSKHFPADMLKNIYGYLSMKFSSERSEGQTNQQFNYKIRKKGFGPFKERMWNLPESVIAAIAAELEERFEMNFKSLGVVDSAPVVNEWLGL